MSIIVKQLSYAHPDRIVLFQNINFTVLKNQKASLIGNNGSGKSTLLRIISNEIYPSTGEIIRDEYPYYVPQHFGQYDILSVAEALRVDAKINALNAILGGDASVENFKYLDDDWSIEERISEAFSYWNIEHIQLSQTMDELSGGEKTKVFLSGIIVHNPSIVLMDEPSNHLDKGSRLRLYEFIDRQKMTLLVVSHDRVLLNLIYSTYELNKDSVTIYGGNYDFYKEQKGIKDKALEERLGEKEKALRAAKKTAREALERKQKMDIRNEKSAPKKGIARIMIHNLKNKAEKSSSKLNDVHTDKIASISNDLKQVRQELLQKKELKLNFEDAVLHTGKILVKAENINFSYQDKATLWKEPLIFEIRSGDRIVINGANGSGKTTLLKLIFGDLEPSLGNIDRVGFSYVYVDQDYSIIDNALTVLEQIQTFNKRNLPEHDLKMLLNRFLFPADTWDKNCGKLSGGEKMWLVFCCLMTENNMPDMFVLDEPTNNLDIVSLEVVTSAIKNYKGTLLLISHDSYFVNEMDIEKTIYL